LFFDPGSLTNASLRSCFTLGNAKDEKISSNDMIVPSHFGPSIEKNRMSDEACYAMRCRVSAMPYIDYTWADIKKVAAT
jgi:hypothetical protein